MATIVVNPVVAVTEPGGDDLSMERLPDNNQIAYKRLFDDIGLSSHETASNRKEDHSICQETPRADPSPKC